MCNLKCEFEHDDLRFNREIVTASEFCSHLPAKRGRKAGNDPTIIPVHYYSKSLKFSKSSSLI